MKIIHTALFFITMSFAAASAGQRAEAPVVPKGFDTALLNILACPENLSPLRLATKSEIDSLRKKSQAGALRFWNGKSMQEPFDGLLIRADEKIAYLIERGVPIMLIDKAVVLDETVGKPSPDAHRTK